MFLSKHCEEIWAYRLHSSVVMAFTQFISITANICLLKLRALSVFLVAWFRFEGRKSAQDAAPLWSPSFTVGLPLHPSTFRAPLRLSLSHSPGILLQADTPRPTTLRYLSLLVCDPGTSKHSSYLAGDAGMCEGLHVKCFWSSLCVNLFLRSAIYTNLYAN